MMLRLDQSHGCIDRTLFRANFVDARIYLLHALDEILRLEFSVPYFLLLDVLTIYIRYGSACVWNKTGIMKKTRFLCIRNLPDGSKGSEIRKVFERFGEVQSLRIFKDKHSRHAIVAFADVHSAIRANTAGVRLSDSFFKPEYCDSLDAVELLNKTNFSIEQSPNERPVKPRPLLENDSNVDVNGPLGNRRLSVSRPVNGQSPTEKQVPNHPTRFPVTSPHTSWLGIKVSNLPSPDKLSEEQLRQGLFQEFRCFGRIVSLFLPRTTSEKGDVIRDAVITFQRPEDASHAYGTLHKSSKLLFSVPISVELHPGFHDGSPESRNHPSKTFPLADKPSNSISRSSANAATPASAASPIATPKTSKCPTRTLLVGGLTSGPNGPVTSEHLTTAFRKFGDIINVQLQSNSNSALIQFAEMRGPLRAMNAHSRNPLRLGGRPLFLAYVPSRPSKGLWLSELPAAFAGLSDQELFRRLSQFAPIREIMLIAKPPSASRAQPDRATAPSTSDCQNSQHNAVYIRLTSTEHATALLNELRLCDHFGDNAQPAAADTTTVAKPRRIVAVDYASQRQTALVNDLLTNDTKSNDRPRYRTISRTSIYQNKKHDPQAVASKQPVPLSRTGPALKVPAVATGSSIMLQRISDHSFIDYNSSIASNKRVAAANSNLLRDSSPSSLSTTSTSSLSSESSASSTSCSSSSVSSCTSSGSSVRSRQHRNLKSKSSRIKSSVSMENSHPKDSPVKSKNLSEKPSKQTTTPLSPAHRLPTATSVSSGRSVRASDSHGESTRAQRVAADGHPCLSIKSLTNQNSFLVPSQNAQPHGIRDISTVSHSPPFSASSGVSSDCRSTYSNSGSDCSPFNNAQRSVSQASTMRCVTSEPRNKDLPLEQVNSSSQSHNTPQHLYPSECEAKSKPELSSDLKLHFSTSGSSTSHIGSPLTVSIKLSSQNTPSQTPTSPRFTCYSDTKSTNGSPPKTPLSAPPLRIPCKNLGRISSPGNKSECSGTETSSRSVDWLSVGSPVYESMYDKIKRRANKEAEKRKQRQLEALNTKDKRRQRKHHKEMSRMQKTSVNGLSESFNKSHNVKSSTDFVVKSHRSKLEPSKFDKISISRNVHPKNESYPALKDTWQNHKRTDTLTSSYRSSRPISKTNKQKSKKARQFDSSNLSGSSADGRDSCSPPETLTRLSLGMRFPVSANYHECVRPSRKNSFKWSADDDSVSQVSSVSCSGSEGSERRAFRKQHTNWSDVLDKVGKINGHVVKCSEMAVNKVLNSSWPICKSNGLDTDKISSGMDHGLFYKGHLKAIDNLDRELNVEQAGKKRFHDTLRDFKDAHKKRRKISDERKQNLIDDNFQTRKPIHHAKCPADSQTVNRKRANNELHASVMEAFTTFQWPTPRRNRLTSGSAQSITDGSSQPVTRSPSPMMSQFSRKLSTTHSIRSSSACDDSVEQMDDDRDSVFGALPDSDHLSSKSTPSTEPMEQEEFIERESLMKLSEDDWHSSLVSTSPHPTTLDFDADYCQMDKTEQSSTTYQSTSFSSQMLSPISKLPSNPGDSDDEDSRSVANDRAADELLNDEHYNTPALSCPPNRNLDGIADRFFSSQTSDLPSSSVPVSDIHQVSHQESQSVSDSPNAIKRDNVCSPCSTPSSFSKYSSGVENETNMIPATSTGLPVIKQTAVDDVSSVPSSTDPGFTCASLQTANQASSMTKLDCGATETTQHDAKVSIGNVASFTASVASNVFVTSSEVCVPTSSVKKSYFSTSDTSKPSFAFASAVKHPADAHDITRYVQSVIERVKAEKVEETQQAASALQHPNCTPNTNVPSNFTSQPPRCENSVSVVSPTTNFKRACISQRKPLLLATTTCSATAVVSAVSESVTVLPPLKKPETSPSSSESSAGTKFLSPVISTTDMQVPSIPGVNACAPLAVSAVSTPGRVTRQSSLLTHSHSGNKRPDCSTICESSVHQTSPTSTSVQASRRRRKSEGKVVKDIITSSTSAVLLSTGSQSLPVSSIARLAQENNTLNSGSTALSSAGGLTTSVKSHSSVDPYEPNFDDESPPSQLHPTRTASPVCSSPTTQVTCVPNMQRPSPIVSNSVADSLQIVNDGHTTSSDISIEMVNSVSTSVDTVDAVISAVCAGQFDVQSYLNNWHTEQNKASSSPNPSMSVPASVITTTVSIASQLKTVTSSVTNTKTFPLSITSEPVVAAVTIPVSSGSNKSSTIAPNGSNSSVNIGTGNALLNTLLAALQLIPGSQVTVTGPAAAGVVGAIGTGAISATTITLPVNAAFQAAANIKAAMLSATGAMGGVCADVPVVTTANDKLDVEPVKFSKPEATQLDSRSTVNVAPAIPFTTAHHQPVVAVSSSSSAKAANPVLHFAGSSIKHAHNSSTAAKSISLDPLKVANSFTEPSVSLPLRSSTDSLGYTTSVCLSRQSSYPQNVHHRPTDMLPSVQPPISNNSIQSPHLSQTRLPTVTTQAHNFKSGLRTATMSSSRNSPAPTQATIAHAIQVLAERLGGAVEPSVLMALAQATASGGGVFANQNESVNRADADNQLFTYLRRLATQLNDPRANLPFGRHNAQPLSSSTSPPLATPHLNPHHQRVPPVTCPLYVNAIGPDNLGMSRPVEANSSISPSLHSPRTLATHSAPNAGTPSASHVSWSTLGQTYPLVWQGRLSLKNAETRVALHYIYGNLDLLHDCMRLLASGGGGQSLISSGGPLRIVQRMRLEISQLEGVQRKIHQEGASCVCLALPAGSGPVELMQQTQILNDSFIRYMQEKMAAGIINVGLPEFQQGLYVIHIFPPCDFSHAQLNLAAPELHCRIVQANQSHLLVVVTTV